MGKVYTDGNELISGGGGGAVDSVFGRTGVVVAVSGDYDADEISETASNKIMTSAERTKLTGIETSADVTDETNVKSALNGATISSTTVSATDKVLVQDVDDSDNLKTVTAQSIADLASGGGGGGELLVAVYMSATQSWTSGSDTKVALNTEDKDVNSEWNTTTHTFTVGASGAGDYLLTFSANGTLSARGAMMAKFYKNGAALKQSGDIIADQATTATPSCATVVTLAVSDTVSFRVYQATGFAVTGQVANTYATISKIG